MTRKDDMSKSTPRKRRRLVAAAVVVAVCAAGTPVALAMTQESGGGGLSTDVGDAKVEAARAAKAAAEPAPLPEPFPLTGEGENMEVVANVPIDFGADIELAGDYAYVSTYGACAGPIPPVGTPFPGNCTPGTGGVTVIDISDPENPERVGLFDCAGGQNDIQLSPDGKWGAMAIETQNNACHPGQEGSVVLSLADPENPVEVAFLPVFDRAGNYEGSHNHLIDWPYLYIAQYTDEYNKTDIFDLSDPANPEQLDPIDYGPPDDSSFTTTSPHDLIVEHRADGKDYLYASSGNQTSDVVDVTDPRAPVILQRLVDPAVDFAHQSELSHDGKYTLITDEYRGGGEARACGKTPTQDGPLDEPPRNETGDRNNLGALYFYETGADGYVVPDANGQPKIAGTYNLPLQTGVNNNAEGCTIHIYWQAPDENRFVVSWYGKGSRVVDYTQPEAGAGARLVHPDRRRHVVGQAAQRLHLHRRHRARLRRAALHGRGWGALALDGRAGRGPARRAAGGAAARRRRRHTVGAEQPGGHGRADDQPERRADPARLGQRQGGLRAAAGGQAQARWRVVPPHGAAGPRRARRRRGRADDPLRRGRDRLALAGRRRGRAPEPDRQGADHRRARDLPLHGAARGPEGRGRQVQGGGDRGGRTPRRGADARLPHHHLILAPGAGGSAHSAPIRAGGRTEPLRERISGRAAAGWQARGRVAPVGPWVAHPRNRSSPPCHPKPLADHARSPSSPRRSSPSPRSP